MKRVVGLVLLAVAAVAFGQSGAGVDAVEFRVGSMSGPGHMHRTVLWFRQAGEGNRFTVAGVTGPNGNPVPAAGALPLELEHTSGHTLALYEPPQPGVYVARFTGPEELEIAVEVAALPPLAQPVVTRLEAVSSTLEVAWEPVPGATQYFVFVRSPGSRGFQPLSVVGPETSVQFRGLPPDTYELTIEARDHDMLLAEDEPLPLHPRVSITTLTFHVQR